MLSLLWIKIRIAAWVWKGERCRIDAACLRRASPVLERHKARQRSVELKSFIFQSCTARAGLPLGRGVRRPLCVVSRDNRWYLGSTLVRFIMASWQSRSKRQGSRVQGEPHRRVSFSLTQVPGGGSLPKERGSGENATHEGGWGVPHRQPATAHTAAGTQGSPPRGT